MITDNNKSLPLEELWKVALGEIEINLSKANFITWFKYTNILKRDIEGTVVISVPNGFSKEWLENKYSKLILKVLRNLNKEIKEVKFEIAGTVTIKTNKIQDNNINKNQLWLVDNKINADTNLNPKYTFNSFIVGASNELAYAASLAVTKNLGKTYNPLLIYGGTGLGKTHLLQAIGNEVLIKNPDKKIKYLDSEKFTNEFINALKNGSTNNFKEKYRKNDVLIIDDVQFLSKKEQTQEEFFHTFNALYEKNKQIILSSDQPPKSIATIDDRLRSRFEGGMIADITPPNYETRMAILKAKLEESLQEINEKTLEWIASNITKNIRELEGALNKVLATYKLNNNNFNEEKLPTILSEFITISLCAITPMKILKGVSEFYEIKIDDLCDKSRKKNLVLPRQIAMYLLREELGYSYSNIGDKFGKRDHTTVIHACGKINTEIAKKGRLLQEINFIREKLLNVK
ncbi:MAG: chromosomal replication initiator protein DnaA [Patescibacteria group bacterium]